MRPVISDYVLEVTKDGVARTGDAPRHNRWHPDIRPGVHIQPGQTVEMETVDALDGQIRRGTTSEDLVTLDVGRVHPLTGPVYIEGAEPGDLLDVHILKIDSAPAAFTATFPGRGLLPDLFPGPLLVHWDLADGFATSEQIPGVRIPGAPFMGTIGVAPSLVRLRRVNEREKALAQTGVLVMPPRIASAIPSDESIAREGWRTAAAHEVGGNMDIRQLVKGSTVSFPVDVPGALFSAGDGHFAQGDGETCGTAMEMSARVTVQFELRKGAALEREQTNPTFAAPPAAQSRRDGGYFATTGLSVSEDGRVSYLDASLAAKNALIMMVKALEYDHGLTRDQAYIVASVAADLKISSIVNVPHAQVSMTIPLDIFV